MFCFVLTNFLRVLSDNVDWLIILYCACSAILTVNVIGGMLEPAKRFLSELYMGTLMTGIKSKESDSERMKQEKSEKKKTDQEYVLGVNTLSLIQ